MPPKKPSKPPVRAKKARPATAPKALPSKRAEPAAVRDLRPAPPPVLGDIPWTYGDTRIVAMAQNPDWGFVYWEFPDEALAAARRKIQDPDAGLHLRVYDSTGIDFNGLNPHRYWDIAVDRRASTHYLDLGRPGACFHVDIGVRSAGGAFAPIARSNALEMPRDSMSPDTRTEWSTILRSGPTSAYRHRYVAPPTPPAAPAGSDPVWGPASPPPEWEEVFGRLSGEGWTRMEWIENAMDGRTVRWIRWTGPVPADFPMPWEGTFRHLDVHFAGEKSFIQAMGGEHAVYGPWHVRIEAVGPGGERRVVQQWVIKHRWITEEGHVVVQTGAILRRVLGGERVTIERGGSEERLARELWGSELLQLGGSERRWAGASERLLGGASEFAYGGASEWRWAGASERLLGGASESAYGGASEALRLGASEERLGGSSEAGP
jgi:hypothetical protein